MADDSERAQPRGGSMPEGGGWLKPWTPVPGATYLVFGAFTQSLVDLTHGPAGIVGCDLTGKWNHGAEDALSLLLRPEVAEEWGQALVDAARAARRDEKRVRRQQGT